MAPSGQTNLAVKDTIVAMQFLKLVLPAFGGSTSKVTISGQSSGADMVRALLGVDSASSLFHSAILQSDPMVRKNVILVKELSDIFHSGLWLFISRDATDITSLLQQANRLRRV